MRLYRRDRLDQGYASFETPAARAPQDEIFLHAINNLLHPEERHGAAGARLAGRWRECNRLFHIGFRRDDNLAA
jgi:hypothetical protein